MCVYSMVLDHYKNPFEKWEWVHPPYTPWPSQPTKAPPTAPIFPSPGSLEFDELRKIIKEFKEALEAAKVVDRLTKQPDCEDPKKAELVKRVEALENLLGIQA